MQLDDLIDSGLGAVEWPHGKESGLLVIQDRARVSEAMNVRHSINQVSIHAPAVEHSMSDSGGALVDTHYGQVYTGMPGPGSAIYGRTEDLAYQPFDEAAEAGYLRVPFGRIPRVPVRTLAQIESIVGVLAELYGADELLFRGQPQEYLLDRPAKTRELLYGDPTALEPSLPASASRRQPSIEGCMGEWMMWVQICQHSNLNLLRDIATGVKAQALQFFHQQMRTQWVSAPFDYFCLALAQHYGLPSVGLDLTDRLATALFFGLHDFREHAPGRLRADRVPTGAEPRPVLYVLRREGSREFSFVQTAHEIFKSGRPERQNAWFLHVGWGLNRNAAARQILIAMVLDPGGDYDPLPRAAELFPGPDQDPLARFLGSIGSRASNELQDVLQHFHWVD